MSGIFNPAQFLDTQIDQAGDTEYILIPEGEYTAISGKRISVREVKTSDGETFYMADLLWEVQSEDVKQLTGRETNVARQSFRLDLVATPDNSMVLDMGKGQNVPLNKLREVFGQNVAGRPWSMRMLCGQPAKIQVKHKPADDASKQPYVNVVNVAKL